MKLIYECHFHFFLAKPSPKPSPNPLLKFSTAIAFIFSCAEHTVHDGTTTQVFVFYFGRFLSTPLCTKNIIDIRNINIVQGENSIRGMC